MPNNTSTPLPDAQPVLGLDHNRLRQDVLNNHAHEGPNDGGAISHTNLADKGTYTHPQIDSHIDTDLSGGVHGVPEGSTVMVSPDGGGGPMLLQHGRATSTWMESGPPWYIMRITFPVVYGAAPTVTVSPVYVSEPQIVILNVAGVTAEWADIRAVALEGDSVFPIDLYWIAAGPSA